jgi:hypothetical protein
MRIEQFIEKLRNYDDDMEVYIRDNNNELEKIDSISEAIYGDEPVVIIDTFIAE